MKKCKKILFIIFVICIIGCMVFPALNIILEKIDTNKNVIFGMLEKITDSIIVKASETDYEYEGNLYLSWYEPGMYWPNDEEYDGVGIYIYKAWAEPTLEYSVNDSEFKELEVQNFGSHVLNLDKDVNTVIAREKETQDIVLKALVVKKDDFYIVFHHATVGHNKGNYVYTLYADKDEEIEYSLDNGETFYKIQNYRLDGTIPRTYWPAQNKIDDSVTMFNDNIIIRDNITKDEFYQTPNIGEITEEYSYENGVTKVKFYINNDSIDNVRYYYEIDNEVFEGNEFNLEEGKNVKLNAVAKIEFMERQIEKEIEVKVINVEKPIINVNEENELEITAGAIENDELEGIYYSIDASEDQKYDGIVKLELTPGEHEINAYQKSKTNIVSEIDTKTITIEEAEEQGSQGEQEEQEEQGGQEEQEEQGGQGNQEEQGSQEEQLGYKILEGANQTYTIGKDSKLTVKADGDISKFKNVKVDKNILDQKNYEIFPGSTIVTLIKEYLNTLQEGKHTLTFVYEDGEISTDFVIAKVETDKDSGETQEETKNNNNEIQNEELENNKGTQNSEGNNNVIKKENNKTDNSAMPKTGDNIIFWIIFGSFFAVAIIVFSKNNKQRKH